MKLKLIKCTLSTAALCLLSASLASIAADTSQGKIKVDDNSFKCITDMTPVKHFYVDNLLGNLDGTVAVAKARRNLWHAGDRNLAKQVCIEKERYV